MFTFFLGAYLTSLVLVAVPVAQLTTVPVEDIRAHRRNGRLLNTTLALNAMTAFGMALFP